MNITGAMLLAALFALDGSPAPQTSPTPAQSAAPALPSTHLFAYVIVQTTCGHARETCYALQAFAPDSSTPREIVPKSAGAFYHPVGLAVAASGELFVADENDTVTKIGKGSLASAIGGKTSGLSQPNGLALDGRGNLYVSNFHNRTVVAYAPGTAIPARTINDPQGLDSPGALATDGAGELYVANVSRHLAFVAVFPPGAARASKTITTGINDPESIACSSAGDLYVANQTSDSIAVFTRGADVPSRTIGGAGSGLHGPASVALDDVGDLYVANTGSQTIAVFAPGDSTPSRTIRVSAGTPVLVAIGPSP